MSYEFSPEEVTKLYQRVIDLESKDNGNDIGLLAKKIMGLNDRLNALEEARKVQIQLNEKFSTQTQKAIVVPQVKKRFSFFR